ncbi:hypothetical protein [Kribbella flavida]|uniref:hypothetical protein n=1 Tax=Kribbella flavida TaxID=182640 RepID=UPI00019BD9FE|nr:hypothetical protein [Kribbella flavida]
MRFPNRRAVLGSFLVGAAVVGCADVQADPATTDRPAAKSGAAAAQIAPAKPKPLPQLPRGGRKLFPAHQLVAFVGAPGAPALGPLDSNLDERARRLERLAAAHRGGRTPLPVMELIVVTAQGAGGWDGKYRSRIKPAEIGRYLAVARKHKMLLMLDVQPGQARPIDEVRRLEPWLRQPDVGLALDPEWEVGPGEVPGQVFGRTSGAELNQIAGYLSALVTKYRLPEKLFVFHQLTKRIVQNEAVLRGYPGVAMVKSVDGIGTRGAKEATYRQLTTQLPRGVHTGFKLFYEEDTRHGALMTPAQVLTLRPRPELVIYE